MTALFIIVLIIGALFFSKEIMIFLIIGAFVFAGYKIYTDKQKAAEDQVRKEKEAMDRAMRDLREEELRQEREARIVDWAAKRKAFSDALAAVPSADVPTTQEAKRKRHRTTADMPAMGSPTITAKSKPERFANFVVVDTETTGLAADKDKIIELAAVRFEDWKPVETWSTYINPRKHIPEKASDINYIYDEDVADAPYIEDVRESFEAFVSKSDLLVGQNLDFDRRFLWCDNIDFPEAMRCLDTLKLARKLYTLPNYKLETVAEHCGIRFPAHRALNDAYATGLVFISCVRDLTGQDAPEALQDPE